MKRIIALIIVITSCLSIYACTNQNSTQVESTPDETTTSDSTTPDSTTPDSTTSKTPESDTITSDTNKPDTVTPQKIQLTKDNWEDYFSLDVTYSDRKYVEGSGNISEINGEAQISLTSTVKSINNVKFVVKIYINDDRRPTVDLVLDHEKELNITIGAMNGQGSQTFSHAIGLYGTTRYPKLTVTGYEVVDVSGTITLN